MLPEVTLAVVWHGGTGSWGICVGCVFAKLRQLRLCGWALKDVAASTPYGALVPAEPPIKSVLKPFQPTVLQSLSRRRNELNLQILSPPYHKPSSCLLSSLVLFNFSLRGKVEPPQCDCCGLLEVGVYFRNLGAKEQAWQASDDAKWSYGPEPRLCVLARRGRAKECKCLKRRGLM